MTVFLLTAPSAVEARAKAGGNERGCQWTGSRSECTQERTDECSEAHGELEVSDEKRL